MKPNPNRPNPNRANQPVRMTPRHFKWAEFYKRLEGPEGCNFQETKPGDPESITWKCAGGMDKSLSRAILQKMGFSEESIEASCAYFDAHGGHCDCEVLFNVEERNIRDLR